MQRCAVAAAGDVDDARAAALRAISCEPSVEPLSPITTSPAMPARSRYALALTMQRLERLGLVEAGHHDRQLDVVGHGHGAFVSRPYSGGASWSTPPNAPTSRCASHSASDAASASDSRHVKQARAERDVDRLARARAADGDRQERRRGGERHDQQRRAEADRADRSRAAGRSRRARPAPGSRPSRRPRATNALVEVSAGTRSAIVRELAGQVRGEPPRERQREHERERAGDAEPAPDPQRSGVESSPAASRARSRAAGTRRTGRARARRARPRARPSRRARRTRRA